MGLYDSVAIKCFKCDNKVEFQSKAGKCRMAEFTVNRVPVEIAIDLNGRTEACKKCGTKIQLSIPDNILIIRMFADEPEEDTENN